MCTQLEQTRFGPRLGERLEPPHAFESMGYSFSQFTPFTGRNNADGELMHIAPPGRTQETPPFAGSVSIFANP